MVHTILDKLDGIVSFWTFRHMSYVGINGSFFMPRPIWISSMVIALIRAVGMQWNFFFKCFCSCFASGTVPPRSGKFENFLVTAPHWFPMNKTLSRRFGCHVGANRNDCIETGFVSAKILHWNRYISPIPVEIHESAEDRKDWPALRLPIVFLW